MPAQRYAGIAAGSAAVVISGGHGPPSRSSAPFDTGPGPCPMVGLPGSGGGMRRGGHGPKPAEESA